MRQYGAIKGNEFESDRPFLVAKARAREKKFAEELIEEQIESAESVPDAGESYLEENFMGDFPWDEDNMWDDELGVVFDHGPLRVSLLEAL
jgi:hypothetical protein